MSKKVSDITLDDINEAFENKLINENNGNDIVYINGIPFKNVHMPLDEYAKSIDAIPYNETKISSL